MKTIFLSFIPCVGFTTASYADETQATVKLQPRVVQDPKSKIIFYLESDQCHVSAIGPDGKLLWCKNMFPYARSGPPVIDEFTAGDGCLRIGGSSGGYGSMGASLDEKTGVITMSEAV